MKKPNNRGATKPPQKASKPAPARGPVRFGEPISRGRHVVHLVPRKTGRVK